jgi:hypothetical protein
MFKINDSKIRNPIIGIQRRALLASSVGEFRMMKSAPMAIWYAHSRNAVRVKLKATNPVTVAGRPFRTSFDDMSSPIWRTALPHQLPIIDYM